MSEEPASVEKRIINGKTVYVKVYPAYEPDNVPRNTRWKHSQLGLKHPDPYLLAGDLDRRVVDELWRRADRDVESFRHEVFLYKRQMREQHGK